MSIASRMLRFTASLAGVTGVVAICAIVPHVHAATVVLVLLLAVLTIANRWGFVESAAAALLGGALWDHFFLLRWRGVEPTERWLALVTFVAVALVASRMAVRAKMRAEDAVARQRELERLYAFGRDLPVAGRAASIVAKGL